MRCILKSLLDDVVSVSEGRLYREACRDAGGYSCSQSDDDRLNSKQTSCIVHLHKPGLSLSLLMGQKQSEKRNDGSYLHCRLSYVYSVIPAAMCHFHTKKAKTKHTQ